MRSRRPLSCTCSGAGSVTDATAQLLAFAAAPHRLPAEVRAVATMLLADTLAVGCAGSTAPGAGGVLAAARLWGDGDAVKILGRADRLPPAGAAFVNGYQIHCLEWDAVHEGAVVHAMSVVTAALLSACAARPGTDPDDAMTALAVGVDIACVLGLAATSPLSFFRPATAGLIGAALACARIAGIPPDRFADVLGLAHAQCAGTMQAHVEGSVALPLQVAAAARAAVTAVDLVANGLTGPHDALTGPFGYFPLFDTGDPAALIAPMGTIWRIGDISVKPWPSGRASHATLAALGGLLAADVMGIEARVPPLIARLVGRPWIDGMTAAYARLCLPFLTALMLTDGRVDPRRFTPDSFADPVLRALGARLAVTIDGNSDANALTPQHHRLTLADGTTRDIATPATLGSPANPLPAAGHAAKHALAAELAAVALDLSDPLAILTGSAA